MIKTKDLLMEKAANIGTVSYFQITGVLLVGQWHHSSSCKDELMIYLQIGEIFAIGYRVRYSKLC